jgi:hypothetical protein
MLKARLSGKVLYDYKREGDSVTEQTSFTTIDQHSFTFPAPVQSQKGARPPLCAAKNLQPAAAALTEAPPQAISLVVQASESQILLRGGISVSALRENLDVQYLQKLCLPNWLLVGRYHYDQSPRVRGARPPVSAEDLPTTSVGCSLFAGKCF